MRQILKKLSVLVVILMLFFTTGALAEDFLNVPTKGTVTMIDLGAKKCIPCKMMAPIFEQAASELNAQFILAKVNTENEQTLAGQYAIRSIPTLAIFNKGQEVKRSAGAMDLNGLKQWALNN